MRLIDADTLIKDLSYLYTKNHIPVDMRAKETLSKIMEQPTAYDIGKVVTELNELDVTAIKRYESGTFGNYEGTDYYIEKSRTIEIVKRGGNEPCCRCDSRQTNADRIRNMSDEELAELITGSLNFDCADYCDSLTQGCAFNCGKKDREIALKWLQSEAE